MGTGGGNVPFVMTPLLKQGTGGDCDGDGTGKCRDSDRQVPDAKLCSRTADLLRGRDMNPRIASGKTVFPTLCSSMGSKQWLGNQEAFSGGYHILEDV